MTKLSKEKAEKARKAMKAAGIQDPSRQTNADFAKKNGRFRAACEEAGVEPTQRQASKYRRGKGAAYATR